MLQRVVASFTELTVVPFGDLAAARFLALKGRVRVGGMDLRIASTALALDMTVVTRNTRDFGRVPGFRTEDWTK